MIDQGPEEAFFSGVMFQICFFNYSQSTPVQLGSLQNKTGSTTIFQNMSEEQKY